MEEKNEVKALKEKLFTRREHGAKILSKEEMKNSQDFSVGYKDFLNKSKTESEAVMNSETFLLICCLARCGSKSVMQKHGSSSLSPIKMLTSVPSFLTTFP